MKCQSPLAKYPFGFLLLVTLLVSGAACDLPGTGLSCDLPSTELSTTITKGISALETISLDELPSQALDTLWLIRNAGPFPYLQDGAVFFNYEQILPRKPNGYYREYTVITPGSRDRGARRIVAGSGGEYYYTADHYYSFKLIQE